MINKAYFILSYYVNTQLTLNIFNVYYCANTQLTCSISTMCTIVPRRASADTNSHDPTTTSTIDPPSILPSEVETSIKGLKCNKAQEEDNITGGILQDGGEALIDLTDLFSTCRHHRQVPKAWKNALMVLIHKKGNTSDIKNYRPISLLPIKYMVLANILRQRMIRTLDFHQLH